MQDVIAIIGPVFLTILFCHLYRKIAPQLGLVDAPQKGRKKHIFTTAVIGGLAIFTCLALSFLLFTPLDFSKYAALLAGMAGMIIIGVYDDRFHIPAIKKLICQAIFLSFFIAFFQFKVSNLGDIFGTGAIQLGWAAYPFTLICCLTLINAVNWIDGLDGLAGGVSCAMLLLLALFFDTEFQPLLWACILSLIGFLCFNLRSPWRHKALIFLGDAGSLMLGFMIAWFVITYSQTHIETNNTPIMPPVMAAWFVAYPIFGLIATIANRVLLGRSIFHADNLHMHFLLRRLGVSIHASTFTLIILAIFYTSIALICLQLNLSEAVLCIAWVMCLCSHIALSRYLVKRLAKRAPLISQKQEDIAHG